jgi:acetyl esterase/lipase
MRNITYCTVDQVELKMDVYSPRSTAGATPLVIFIHGGGWSEGNKMSGEYLFDAPALLDLGYTVASLNYRLAPDYKFPAMIEDVKCAVRSFRAHAGDYQIDPDSIGVWGTSAGGHLVNLVGTTDAGAGFEVGEYLEQSSRVQAVLDMYGPADMTVDFSNAFIELKESVFGDFDLVKASPVTFVSPDDPPFLILQGDSDHVVPLSQSQAFYDSLTAAGVDAQLVVVQGGGHGFHTLNISPSRAELSAMIVEFFEEHLQNE